MGFKAQGTQVRRGDGATTEVFTTIAEIVDSNGPDGSAGEIDLTHLLSSAIEIAPALPDEGAVVLNGNFVGSDAEQQGLWDDRANQVLRNFEVEFTDMPAGGTTNTIFAFSAYVLDFQVQAQTNGKLGFTARLRITGSITPTWAT